ncbi:MAG: iron ABC transporter permease [Actinobacteria bacterium]|nr:iron ABC transporter permease [Actinomycetota bacterium]
MTPTVRARLGTVLAAAVPVVFVAVLFGYPVAAIVGRGLAPEGTLDPEPLRRVFTDPALRGVVWFTVWQAALSTLCTLVLALPGAYVLARLRFPGRSLVRALVTVPFVLPTVLVANAFLALGVSRSLGAILLAHVFFNYAVVVRVVGTRWRNLDPHEAEAARMLGASRWRVAREVTAPALRPAVVAAATITFLFCFTSFGVVLFLGGPTRTTLETEIHRQTTRFLDLPLAAALSVVQLAAVLALLWLVGRSERRAATPARLRAAREIEHAPRTPGAWVLLTANLLVMTALLLVPMAVLVVRSLTPPSGFGLDAYRALGDLRRGSTLFVPPLEAVGTSVRYALAAATIAVVVGGLAAWAGARSRSRWLDGVLAVPLGVSAVTLGFGFLIALDEGPLDLRGSAALVPLAQALVALPFVVLLVGPVLRSIDPRLREAAAMLGASPGAVRRRIDLPIAARALFAAGAFAVAISLGEFGATTFVARPDAPTLPVVIARLLGQPGEAAFHAAMAASGILMVLVVVAVVVGDRARVGRFGDF